MTKRKYKGSNRREIICISAVVFILLCVMLVQSSQLKDKNAGYAQQVEKLNAQLEEENLILKKAIAIFTPHSSND